MYMRYAHRYFLLMQYLFMCCPSQSMNVGIADHEVRLAS